MPFFPLYTSAIRLSVCDRVLSPRCHAMAWNTLDLQDQDGGQIPRIPPHFGSEPTPIPDARCTKHVSLLNHLGLAAQLSQGSFVTLSIICAAKDEITSRRHCSTEVRKPHGSLLLDI